LRGELQTAAAALEEIERLAMLHSLAPEVLEQLKTEHRERIVGLPQ